MCIPVQAGNGKRDELQSVACTCSMQKHCIRIAFYVNKWHTYVIIFVCGGKAGRPKCDTYCILSKKLTYVCDSIAGASRHGLGRPGRHFTLKNRAREASRRGFGTPPGGPGCSRRLREGPGGLRGLPRETPGDRPGEPRDLPEAPGERPGETREGEGAPGSLREAKGLKTNIEFMRCSTFFYQKSIKTCF